jgi:hypothetical protein
MCLNLPNLCSKMQDRTKKSPLWAKTNSLKRENSREPHDCRLSTGQKRDSHQRPTRLSEKTLESQKIFLSQQTKARFTAKAKLTQASPKRVQSEKTPEGPMISRSNSLKRVE